MKKLSLAIAALLVSSGAALAQTAELPTIQVHGATYPDSKAALSFHCGNLSEPNVSDVESVLEINDRTQTQRLGKKLMEAVGDACAHGLTHIVVSRGKDGKSVSWYSADTYHRDVVH
jgi:hypothetical protein